MSVLTFLQKEYWLLQILFLLFFTMLVSFLARRTVHRLQKNSENEQNFWLNVLYEVIQTPLTLLIYLVGLGYGLRILQLHFTDWPILSLIVAIKNAGILAVFVWFLLRTIRKIDTAFLNHEYSNRHFDVTTVHAVSQLIRVVIFVSVLLIVMQSVGVPISALLAFGGAGTVVVGLAGKDLLANFFGGLMIYMDKPFKVGDWIRSPDREIEGIVETIGWRLTRIRSFEKRPLYVPNALFSTIIVENPSRMRNRRIRQTLNVRYKDIQKLPAILKGIDAMLAEHPGIDKLQTYFVHLSELGDSSLNFLIYAFTKATRRKDFQATQEDILLKSLAIIHQHDADCAFPTQTLDLPDDIKNFIARGN